MKLFICPLGECGSNGEAVQIHYSLPTSQFPGPYFPINHCLVGGKMSAESQSRKVFNFKKKTIFPIQPLPGVCVASTLKDRVSVLSVESGLFCNTQVRCSPVPSGGMCRLGCAPAKRFEGINYARRDSGGLPGSSVTASYVSLWKSHLCEACKLLPIASHPEQKLTRQREEGVHVLFLQTQGPWLDVPFRFHLVAESGIPHPNLVFSQMADSAVSVACL